MDDTKGPPASKESSESGAPEKLEADLSNSITNPQQTFEELFEQVNDLLEFALDNASNPTKKDLTAEVLNKLSDLEKDVNAFCDNNERFIALSVSKGHGCRDNSHLSKIEQRQVDRSDKLLKKAKDEIQKMEEEAKALEKKPSAATIGDKERRKHFKRIARREKNI